MKQLKVIALSFFIYIIFFHSASYAEFHHVDDCYVCHDWTKFGDPTANNVAIRNIIQTPNSGDREVVFKDRVYSDDNFTDYADGDTLFNGICEVCHTVNNHHRNDGSDNTAHFDGQRCTACHLHINEFAPPVEQAHRTHLDYRGKGPLITDCAVCHTPPIETDPNYQFSNSTNQSLTFRDGNTLATTTVCDNCHSPWGNYPGGDEATALMESLLGAKANFRTGIYESDGYTLKAGKEKWCVTCHDDKPSSSNYDADPATAPTPFTVDYLDPAMTFVGGSWSNRSTTSVPHMRNAGGTPANNEYMTFDFNVSATGSYRFSTKWAGTYDQGTCSTADGNRPLLISLTDSNGTTLKSYEHSGESPEFSEMASFEVVAGPAQLKVQKDNITCTVNIGPIKVDPLAGSGGVVVIAPMIAGDDKTWGFYATGHGVSGVQCTECHDPRKKHIDYDRRTFNMGVVDYDVINPWGDSYRLQTKDPIGGSSLCARCHDMELIWDRANKVAQTNYKTATGGNYNLHAVHNALNTTGRGDADWDGVADGDVSCAHCHNVHGSTNPHMFRDGNLVSTPYTSDKKPMFPIAFEVYAKATWKPVLQGGSYEVFARWPDVNGSATNAPFTIKSSEIFSTTVKVDQSANADTWVSLGTYNFSDDNQSYVMLNDKETDGTVVADAIKFVSAGETIIVDNGDADYTTLEVNASLSGTTGYNGDYDAITAGSTTFNVATSPKDSAKPLLVEQRNLYIEGTGMSGIGANNICRTCHSADVDRDVDHFTGPKIISRFEDQRWVMNDGTEDAEVYVTARDYDSNISSVTLDLTPIGGGVVAMNPVGQQLYHYTIPGSMINGLSDISYKLPVTAIDTDAQSVTDETYIFPKDGENTIYLDTNNVELYNVHNFRLGVNTGGASWGRIPSDTTYFGPGYRFEITNLGTGNYGKWTPNIPTTGKYEVYAFWPALAGQTTTSGVYYEAGTVKYTAYAADGTFEVLKDQTIGTGQWNYIGTYSFLDDESNYIRQESNDSMAMVADAMKFVRVNSEPLVRLSASQLDKKTRIISTTDRVILSAVATDYDPADTLDTITYDWSLNDAEILDSAVIQGNYGDKLNFNPAVLSVGFHTVQVTVTDTSGASTTVKLALQVLDAYPVLDAVDTDGDGINDDVEGFTDFDEDGIPNYLDDSNVFNVIPAGSLTVVTEEGLEVRIGSTAIAVNSDDSVITTEELNTSGTGGENGLFDGETNVGGLFDFDIVGLKAVGQSVKVVIPLQGSTIPVGATYKKYDADTGWQVFVIDANNAIHSAPSVAGLCPAPGSASYITGLNVGDDCIQLTIRDGGPNDADGIANAEVKDPGGLFATAQASTIVFSGSSGGGGGGSFTIWSLLILGLFGIRSVFTRRH